jgi:heme/copper-type cytochrome/quinol oxidase subunit 1
MNLQNVNPLLIRQRPYSLLLLKGLVFVVTSFFLLKSGNEVDIHFHDTYYVIGHAHVFRLLATLALVLWTLYLLTFKMLYSKMLTWIHVIITILTLLFLILTLYFDNHPLNPPFRRFYDIGSWQVYNSFKYTNPVNLILCILMIGQIVFVINFIAGCFKRKT